MEALYACLVDGNNMDSEWWGDLGLELLSQSDLLSDFMYFCSIVNKDVNGGVKFLVFFFFLIGVVMQYERWIVIREARTGKKIRKGRLIGVVNARGPHGLTVGREIEADEVLTDDEKEFSKIQSKVVSLITTYVEDIPQLILVLYIQSKLERFDGFAIFSYYMGTINVMKKNYDWWSYERRYTELGIEVDGGLENMKSLTCYNHCIFYLIYFASFPFLCLPNFCYAQFEGSKEYLEEKDRDKLRGYMSALFFGFPLLILFICFADDLVLKDNERVKIKMKKEVFYLPLVGLFLISIFSVVDLAKKGERTRQAAEATEAAGAAEASAAAADTRASASA